MVLLKGISPLVAAVLLIAITMTLAGALAYWASTFVGGSLARTSNQSIATECQFVRFQIYACSYDSASSQLNIILNNIGTVDLQNVTLFFIYNNNSIATKSLIEPVTSGTFQPFVVKNVDGTYSKISARLQNCPDVAVESTCR